MKLKTKFEINEEEKEKIEIEDEEEFEKEPHPQIKPKIEIEDSELTESQIYLKNIIPMISFGNNNQYIIENDLDLSFYISKKNYNVCRRQLYTDLKIFDFYPIIENSQAMIVKLSSGEVKKIRLYILSPFLLEFEQNRKRLWASLRVEIVHRIENRKNYSISILETFEKIQNEFSAPKTNPKTNPKTEIENLGVSSPPDNNTQPTDTNTRGFLIHNDSEASFLKKVLNSHSDQKLDKNSELKEEEWLFFDLDAFRENNSQSEFYKQFFIKTDASAGELVKLKPFLKYATTHKLPDNIPPCYLNLNKTLNLAILKENDVSTLLQKGISL